MSRMACWRAWSRAAGLAAARWRAVRTVTLKEMRPGLVPAAAAASARSAQKAW
jgi:hypothetical protein